MAESLQSDSVADMLISTLKDLGRPNWNEIASDYQEYTGFNDLLRMRKKTLGGGQSVQRQIAVTTPGNARRLGAYAVINSNANDALLQVTSPHRLYGTNYSVDEYLLAQNQHDPAQIVNEIQKARWGGMQDLAELTEPDIWGVPTDSADTDMIHGFKYWLVYNATAGHNGGAASGFTTVGGINPTTYAGWKNYTFNYAAVNEDDLLDKWRTASKKCSFKPPVAIPEYQGGGMDWSWYTTEVVDNALLKLTRNQNENLKLQLYDAGGTPVFRSVPVQWVPALDDANVAAARSDPIYGVNWKTFELNSLTGFFMRELPPIRPSDQPLVRTVHVFLSFNLLCTNRRKNMIGAKVQP